MEHRSGKLVSFPAAKAGSPGDALTEVLRQGAQAAAELLDHDWDRMVTFYQFPEPHWRHLRTTNIVGSPFCGLRLRTDAARRYKKVEHATAVLWKLLLVAERRFRRLNSPELLKEVFEGVQYADGVRARSEEAAA